MQTEWRDKPVNPTTYEDIVQVAKLARRARNRTIDFEWDFTATELRQIREAVFFWGKGVTGRFKRFHSRVLRAINEALGEPDSIYAIPAFRDHKTDSSCEVTTLAKPGSFCMRGHATFASIYGYGSAATSKDEGIVKRLGSTVPEKLITALRQLGWDMDRMRDERLVGARHAVYGVSWDTGDGPPPMSEDAIEIDLRFQGPFRAVVEPETRCIFQDPMGSEKGIYLWTFPVEGAYWVAYVGETHVSFKTRLGQHVSAMLSGQYTIHDIDEVLSGKVKRRIWPPSGDSASGIPDFIARYDSLAPTIQAYVRGLHFYVAPLHRKKHILKQVESLLGRHFETHSDKQLSDFFGAGGRWAKPVPHSRPVRVRLSWEGTITGMVPELSQQT